jgi:drug/metabolite transporter (DMT)-like permease
MIDDPAAGAARSPAAAASSAGSPNGSPAGGDVRRGALMVFVAAIAWSFGGVIARSLETTDSWTIVAWRGFFAAAFLMVFMLKRDGVKGTATLFLTMGAPGMVVALCFACASVSFVVALSYTTVANILLMQAGVPLIAALMGAVFLRERVDLLTWCAIVTVGLGIVVMVWDSFSATISPLGDGLALLIAFCFALATVVTRRYSGVRMTPAVTLGALIGTAIGVSLSSGLIVSLHDFFYLFLFGAFNLGLGLALFVTGARLIPSALAALISLCEPIFGPVWVWLFHGETPANRTLIGGAIVFTALVAHILWQWRLHRRTALPIPN